MKIYLDNSMHFEQNRTESEWREVRDAMFRVVCQKGNHNAEPQGIDTVKSHINKLISVAIKAFPLLTPEDRVVIDHFQMRIIVLINDTGSRTFFSLL